MLFDDPQSPGARREQVADIAFGVAKMPPCLRLSQESPRLLMRIGGRQIFDQRP